MRLHSIKLLKPLSVRDFGLLWTGMTVSFLGDGVYVVALAWQVYDISNAPTALSVVGLAWTLPMVLFLLLGGVVSDRFDRRKVMIASDLIRGAAVVTIGVLSITGSLHLWNLIPLVAVFGVGEAFFGPAFGAIVPDIVPREMLLEANSLDQFVRPLTFQLAGPALGGLIVHIGGGAGPAFLVDAGTFAISALCLLFVRTSRRPPERSEGGVRAAFAEVQEGFRFVKSETWLWATICAAGLTLLVFWGPFEVLVPFLVRNDLGGGADDLGIILASGGVGAVVAAVTMAQVGLPRHHVRFMYVCWLTAISSIAGFGFVNSIWQASIVGFFTGAGESAGLVVWATMMHRLVPQALLGRVTSLDWVVSTGLVPVSFALTGPLAATFGVRETMIGAGVLGCLATLSFMFVPGLYDTERDGRLQLVSGEPEENSESISV
ncbi:MAG: MFS transporter [Actinomycetota bacterium]|nr:MFS transporter [Actinomycetota bacterium]